MMITMARIDYSKGRVRTTSHGEAEAVLSKSFTGRGVFGCRANSHWHIKHLIKKSLNNRLLLKGATTHCAPLCHRGSSLRHQEASRNVIGEGSLAMPRAHIRTSTLDMATVNRHHRPRHAIILKPR